MSLPSHITAPESPEIRRERLRAATQQLDRALNPIWDLGRNSVVGWRSCEIGIEILTMSTARLLLLCRTSDQYSCDTRQMGNRRYLEALTLPGAKTTQIALPAPVGAGPGTISPALVNSLVSRYAVTKTAHRGVGLFDIVGFSKCDPLEQVAQLSSLEYSINVAHKRLRGIGIDLNLARSTTGDGFYVWNRDIGVDADLAIYLLVMLALTDNATARRMGGADMVPLLRVCFAVGSHYSYYQVEGLNPRGYDYIVGEVTISLARMMDRCMPGQILIGEFERPMPRDKKAVNAINFVLLASDLLERFRGMRLTGGIIRRCVCYLTGEQIGPGCYNILRFEIQDKHGFVHQAYNQKMNITLDPSEPGAKASHIFLGKQQDEMAEFDIKFSHVMVED